MKAVAQRKSKGLRAFAQSLMTAGLANGGFKPTLCYKNCFHRCAVIVKIFGHSLYIVMCKRYLFLRNLTPIIMEHVISEYANFVMSPSLTSFCNYTIRSSKIDSISE